MDPIAELRLAHAKDPGSYVGKALLRYLTQSTPGGLSVDECLGLPPPQDVRAWLRRAAFRSRDNFLRWYGAYLCNASPDGLSLSAQAAQTHEAAERYRRGRWRFDKHKAGVDTGYIVADDTHDEILFRLLMASRDLGVGIPGKRQIRRILAAVS